MPPPDTLLERKVLLRSIASTAVLGVLGIVWGIASGSQMILLDGVYAIVGIALSMLLLRASTLAGHSPSRRFPYGREAATPLAIAVQGFVLLGTLIYAAVEAVATIREGGSTVTAVWAIAYGVIVTIASVAVWWWLQRVAGHSDLLVSEATGWAVASLRGVGMVVGFVVLAALTGSTWSRAAPYIDPTMVLVTCVLLVWPPIGMVRDTVTELLEGAPSDSVSGPVMEAIASVRGQFDLDEPEVYMTKVGPKLYVEIDGTAGPGVTIAQLHEVRLALLERLEPLPYEVWLNVELQPRTTDHTT